MLSELKETGVRSGLSSGTVYIRRLFTEKRSLNSCRRQLFRKRNIQATTEKSRKAKLRRYMQQETLREVWFSGVSALSVPCQSSSMENLPEFLYVGNSAPEQERRSISTHYSEFGSAKGSDGVENSAGANHKIWTP